MRKDFDPKTIKNLIGNTIKDIKYNEDYGIIYITFTNELKITIDSDDGISGITTGIYVYSEGK